MGATVEEAIDYKMLIDKISDTFDRRYQDDAACHVRIVGLVFASPNSRLAKEEIIPRINEWHCRSGEHIDFYFAGYTNPYGHPPVDGYQEVKIPGRNEQWFYSDTLFSKFRHEFQSLTTWKYGGNEELLLINAHFDSDSKKARLDFGSMMCCRLDVMKNDRTILNVGEFFESVFKFAENSINDTNPTYTFSNKQGIGIACSALKRFLLSHLPKGLDADYRRAEHLAVRDFARRK